MPNKAHIKGDNVTSESGSPVTRALISQAHRWQWRYQTGSHQGWQRCYWVRYTDEKSADKSGSPMTVTMPNKAHIKGDNVATESGSPVTRALISQAHRWQWRYQIGSHQVWQCCYWARLTGDKSADKSGSPMRVTLPNNLTSRVTMLLLSQAHGWQPSQAHQRPMMSLSFVFYLWERHCRRCVDDCHR
jgi:hypothetical protein